MAITENRGRAEELPSSVDVLRGFYGALEELSLRHAFVTGITCFSRIGLFSDANPSTANLEDLSFPVRECSAGLYASRDTWQFGCQASAGITDLREICTPLRPLDIDSQIGSDMQHRTPLLPAGLIDFSSLVVGFWLYLNLSNHSPTCAFAPNMHTPRRRCICDGYFQRLQTTPLHPCPLRYLVHAGQHSGNDTLFGERW